MSKADAMYEDPFPYDVFYDPRPLTEEVLEQLGFKYNEFSKTHELEVNGVTLFKWVEGGLIKVDIDICGTADIWKTVGGLKMLIESLKEER